MGREIRQKHIAILSSVANLLGTAALALAGWYGWGDYNRTAIILMVIGVILLSLTPLATALLTIESETLTAVLLERTRSLAMFTEFTHGLFKLREADDLRITLLVVDRTHEPPILRQQVRCTNTGQKLAGTSTMTIQQGIAGKCFRDVGVAAVNFTGGDFIQHMVDLGFTRQEAKQFERRGAYLCVPIVDSVGEVIAVLSVDVKAPNVLTPDHTEIAEWVTPFFAKYLTQPERGDNRQ